MAPCPSSSASALSSSALFGSRTSMIWSCPPETIRPSGYCSLGGIVVSELTNAFPFVLMVLSYEGGVVDSRFQRRTVPSREADTTVVGWGKTVLRTWGHSGSAFTYAGIWSDVSGHGEAYIVFVASQRGGQLEVGHGCRGASGRAFAGRRRQGRAAREGWTEFLCLQQKRVGESLRNRSCTKPAAVDAD